MNKLKLNKILNKKIIFYIKYILQKILKNIYN